MNPNLNQFMPSHHPVPNQFSQQQQQAQFNPGFMNQMQQFSSGMAAMGFNPLFQQQIFQDALAMSQPVEAADEPLLVQVLLSAKKRRESYKDALNSLHGVSTMSPSTRVRRQIDSYQKNGHSASLWKDYYLDHKDHIDTWINMCLQKEKSQSIEKDPRHTNARPFPGRPIPHMHSIKRESSPVRLPASAPPANKKRKHSSPGSATPVPAIGRSTMNSLTVPEPVFSDRMPPPNADIKIPEPPSRSPSPPTKVIPQGRGNKYTEEDRQFFLKFISWRLKQDPSLSRNDLCNMLAEKAPHHTAQSWGSHWSNRHDVPDKILAAARGESVISDEDDDDDDDEPEKIRPTKRKPVYKEVSSDEEENEEDEEDEGQSGKAEEDDAEDDGKPIKHYSESEMGQKGEPFTDADLYMAAKHAAKFNNWVQMASKDRWEPFAEKFTQRSAKSWAEYYRRNEDGILKLRKRMRKQMQNGTFSENCARPNQPQGKRAQPKPRSEETDDRQRRNRTSSADS
ncbi:hypothetical protein NP233_g10820 [Leucocoprinus birnbaumii]|uniref:Uncharacterized protein n=1 Tax=Leucocoprinus birnbaumii TaxID=56174 RepID=A0AAD5VHP6_9AGAR|nr:hypothetical protein NP233_g10820 [Leucocoprinus birnbaumii]